MSRSAVALAAALFVAALVAVAAPARGRPAPLDAASSEIILDYQRMETLRNRLRQAIVHVAVVGTVQPGFDPDFAPLRTGAATFVHLPDGRELILTSAPLVAEAQRITLVRRSGQESPARVVRTLAEYGVAVLEAADRRALRDIDPLPLREAPEALDVGRTVFSLDNLASDLEVVAWGQIEENGEPPLAFLRVASLNLTGGHPLVDATAHVAGVCFRAVTPTSPVCFAARVSDLLPGLTGTAVPDGETPAAR